MSLPTADDFKAAVEALDAEAVRAVVQRPAAAGWLELPLFSFDAPALAYAANRRSRPVMEVLLDAGADPDGRSAWPAGGFSALDHLVGATGDLDEDLARWLIERGATVDLHAAAGLGDLEVLLDLIAGGADVNRRGPDGAAPLHLARDAAIVDALIDAGADPDQRDVDHRSTPAMWAARSRHETLRRLYERGATPDLFGAALLGERDHAERCLHQLDARVGHGAFGDEGGDIYRWCGIAATPLAVAREAGHASLHEWLLSQASPAQRLEEACACRDAARVDALVADGVLAAVDEGRRWRCLCLAPALMLAHGVDPDLRGEQGETAIHHAAFEGDVTAVGELLDAGMPLVRDPSFHASPVSWAAFAGQEAAVALFVERCTLSLHDAAITGSVHAIDEALARGEPVDGEAPDLNPLRVAAFFGREAAVVRLLEAGADARLAHPESGSTARDLALARGHLHVARRLP